MGTGGGKSRIFSKIVFDARSKNRKVLVIVNKLMLVDNAIKEMKLFVDDISTFTGKNKKITSCTVGTIQSLIKDDNLSLFDVIIVDEAHRFQMDSISHKLKKDIPVIGFCATPYRGKTKIYGPDKFWTLAYNKSLKELTNEGYLVPITYYGQKASISFDVSMVKKNSTDYVLSYLQKMVNEQKEKISLQVQDALSKSHGREKIIIVTTGIQHCEEVAKLLHNSVTLHSKMNDNDRKISWDNFTKGDARFLVSVLAALLIVFTFIFSQS